MGNPYTSSIQVLTPLQRVMIDLHLQGQTHQQIADTIDRAKPTVATWMLLPWVKDEVARRRVEREKEADELGLRVAIEAKAELRRLGRKAVGTLDKLMDSEEERVALGAARTVIENVMPKDKDGPGGAAGAGVVLDAETAQLLIAALAEANRVATQYPAAQTETTNEIEQEQTQEQAGEKAQGQQLQLLGPSAPESEPETAVSA